jgi:hypothetical protein
VLRLSCAATTAATAAATAAAGMRWLDLCSGAVGARYADIRADMRGDLPPHVYSTGAMAYSGLTRQVSTTALHTHY